MLVTTPLVVHERDNVYHMNEEEKEIGVIIDEELKFHKYVAATVYKSTRMLGLIRATFPCLVEVTVPPWLDHNSSMGTSYDH